MILFPNDAKSCKITDSETEGSFRHHQLERQVSGQKPPGHKPPDKNTLDKNPPNGQLALEGPVVPNSNIVDLENDVMRKRKGFNLEHSNTFAKALAKINVPEDYVRNTDRIDSIRWFGRLQDSHTPGPSFVSESVEASTEVPRRKLKNPTTSALCLWKVVKCTSIIELLRTLTIF